MKITEINTFILSVPLGKRSFYSSQCVFPERNSLIVQIKTDEGIVGWGEGGQYGPPEPVAACINFVIKPLILNEDPREPVKLWEKMYAFTRDFGQKGTYIEAISAIDIALWDIQGKSLGVPIYRLLGGAFRKGITAYATGCYYHSEDGQHFPIDTEGLKAEALSYIKAGFNMVKIKIGLLSIEEDLKRIIAIREAIGPNIKILIDCNHAYNSSTIISFGRVLEKYNIGWIEEPVPPEDKEGYKRVRNALKIPIAGGECEYTRYGFRDLIINGCVDIIQPDLCVSGGFSEFLKIHALASSFNLLLIPHVWGSGIALASALHALACLPPLPHTINPISLQNEPVIEFDQSPNPLRDDLLKDRINLIDGKLLVPYKPGLGIEVREDILEKYLK